jgi:hypothetical protein
VDLLSSLFGFRLKFSESGFLCLTFPLGFLLICNFLQSRYFFGLIFLVLPKSLISSRSLLLLALSRLLVSQLLLPGNFGLPVCLLLLLLASGLLLLQLECGLLLQLHRSFLLFLEGGCSLVISHLFQPQELCFQIFIFLLLNALGF